MATVSRRRFLIAGGAGAVVVAAGGAILAIRQFGSAGGSGSSAGTLTFQAVAPLPRPPLVSYASYVIAGQVDLSNNSGTITKTVFAGPPDERLPIELLTRSVRVSKVETQGSSRRITGTVTDPAQLQQGESASFTIVIDADHKTAQSDFFGDAIQLQMEQFKDTSR